MDRREFLIMTGSCVASGCAILSGGASHRAWKPLPTSVVGDKLEVPLKEVEGLGTDDALLVQIGQKRPDLLIAKRTAGYLVVTADCTHLGCTVGWNGSASEWQCPCHGSRYAPDGKVIHGPAEEALQSPKVHLEADHLVIELAGLS